MPNQPDDLWNFYVKLFRTVHKNTALVTILRIVLIAVIIGASYLGVSVHSAKVAKLEKAATANAAVIQEPPSTQVETENTSPAQTNTNTTPNDTPKSTTSSSSAASSKASGGCRITITPYQTTYINDPNLASGRQRVGNTGFSGSVTTCPGKAPLISAPINKVVYIGTYTAPTAPPESTPSSTPTYSYSQALSIAQGNCSAYSNSSNFQTCVNAYMHEFGY